MYNVGLIRNVERMSKRRITMGWISKIVSVVAGPAAGTVAGVVTGEKPADAVKDAVTAPVAVPVSAATAVASSVADAASRIDQMEADLVKQVGGDGARNLFLDVRRVVKPMDEQAAAKLLDSVQQFVNTLDVSFLDPLVGLVAAEMQRTRENFWDEATAIPEDVINLMPSDLAELARASRYASVADVNKLSLPAFAIEHFDLATAITLIDLIFFQEVPGSETDEDRHTWAHELTHVRQYRTMGLLAFAKEYTHEGTKAKITGGLNPLEAEADRYACKYFPIEHPHYIGSCGA
jgi:uncharacterized protein DUF4157